MDEKLKKLEKEIKSLEEEILEKQTRRQEAQERISSAEQRLDELLESLKQALLVDDEKEVLKLEAEISKCRTEILKRDAIFIEALNEELPKLEQRLSSLKSDRNKVFGQLTERWLKSEIGKYDGQAKQTIEAIKRLLVAHRLLWDIGYRETYRNIVGPGYEILPSVRIPILKDFNRTEFLAGGALHSGKDTFDQVLKEIVSQ